MVGGRLGDTLKVREELITKACSLALKHRASRNLYEYEKIRGSSEAVFIIFPGSFSADGWISGKSFGDTKIDPDLFPSLKSIGNDEAAALNEAFFRRFEAVCRTESFEKEVIPNPIIVIDFIHFVMRYDIVPRLMLAPLTSMKSEFQMVLDFFNPSFRNATSSRASSFFENVMRNASSVASRTACKLMGSTNPLLETVTSFIELSPYRPFGTYIFCTGNGKLVVVENNSDAILQILFYSSQPICAADIPEVASKSSQEHLGYADELKESIEGMQDVAYLDNHLKELPLSSDSSVEGEIATVNTALNDLGLSTRGRLCLRAAGEFQMQKQRNQDKINLNKKEIEAKLDDIRKYKDREVQRLGYYDAFKLQKYEEDFLANVKRLELAGMWDEIIEMLKRYELPDEFEGQTDWIVLGTKYRQLVEPLDIANYYRHYKNDDTGSYLNKDRPPRPKRYRYTQKWREHDQRMAQGSSSESCFWATVEELSKKKFEDMKKEILAFEREVLEWFQNKEIGNDVFLGESTFSKWWKTLPPQHRQTSCLAGYMSN